jgi:hypothetical protein
MGMTIVHHTYSIGNGATKRPASFLIFSNPAHKVLSGPIRGSLTSPMPGVSHKLFLLSGAHGE